MWEGYDLLIETPYLIGSSRLRPLPIPPWLNPTQLLPKSHKVERIPPGVRMREVQVGGHTIFAKIAKNSFSMLGDTKQEALLIMSRYFSCWSNNKINDIDGIIGEKEMRSQIAKGRVVADGGVQRHFENALGCSVFFQKSNEERG